jgi:hypothetical protein
MKKSLIVCWIANNDYPLFRAWLEKNHSFFDEIIIHWDIMFRFPFYNAFIQSSLSHIPNIKFLDMTERELGVDDWRNAATNAMLKEATGDWIISIEQDWFCQEWQRLFNSIEDSIRDSDMFGWWNPTNAPYVHPAFWGIKRELLENTTKDFSPHPEINGSDHFAKITYDAQALQAKIDKYHGNLSPNTPFFHLGGVNQNYLNFDELFKLDALHRPEIFYVYNYWSRKAHVRQSETFMSKCKAIEMYLRTKYPHIDFETSEWSKFFQI